MEKAYLYIADIAKLDVESIMHKLPAQRRAYVLRCVDEETRRQRAAATLLCAYALRELGEYSGVLPEWSKDENGKPYIENSRWYFNISHSGRYVCCALADTMQIGADVQKMEERDFLLLAKRFCSKNEYMRLSSFGPDELKSHFYAFWARKEALAKRDGVPNKDFCMVDVTKRHVCCLVREDYMYAVAADKAFELIVREVSANWL